MWEGGGVKPKLHFLCATFRFGWVFPTQEAGLLSRVLLPFIFSSMVFIFFVTFCVLVPNPLPYDRWLLDAFTHICSNQPGIRRYTDVKAHIVELISLLTISLILKKEMAALEEGRVCAPCTLMHFQEPDSQPACAASRQSVARLWCFFNTAAVHFLRHVDYPWFQLCVSTQDVCSKQHAMLRTTPVYCHCGHQLRFSQRKAFEKYSFNIMHRKVEDISQP